MSAPPACAGPAGAPSRCTFVAISDTHNQHSSLALPLADVLLHAGDATMRGTLAELADFAAWLKAQPHPTKVYCGGNHDVALDASESFAGEWARGKRGGAARADCAAARALFTDAAARAAGVVLLDDGETFRTPAGGFAVWGSAFVPEVWGAFNVPRGAALAARFAPLADARADADVVLAHSPPARLCDAVCVDGPDGAPYRRHVGSAELAAALAARGPARKPAVIVCGHIHEGYGGAQVPGARTYVVNAAVVDTAYRVANPPVVFALERDAAGQVCLELLEPTSRAELEAWAHAPAHRDPCVPDGVRCLADLPEEPPPKRFVLGAPPARAFARPASADAAGAGGAASGESGAGT